MLTVDVPLNTMLADLDETLRGLLRARARAARVRRRRHRVRRARARLVGPALQADGEPLPLRPARGRGAAHERVVAGPARRPHVRGPPADGHGVLLRGHRVDAGRRGRAPAALAGARDLLRLSRSCRRTRSTGGSPTARQAWPIKGRIGQGKGEKSDFWSAVGGQYKVSLDYVVRLSRRVRRARSSAARKSARRPCARGCRTARRARSSRCTAPSARCKNKKGEPLADVWVTLPDVGSWTSSAADGRFRFDRLPPGRHRLLARTADGREADAQLEVPGAGVDLVIDGKGDRTGRHGLPEWLPRSLWPPRRRTRKGWDMATEPGPRVLLGNLGPIMRLGMNRVLSEEGCQVVGQEDRPSAIIGAAHRLRPDIVVLDLDNGPRASWPSSCAAPPPRPPSCSGPGRRTSMEVLEPASSTSASRRRSDRGAAAGRTERPARPRVKE